MVNVTSLLIKAENALVFNFGVRAQIWCVKGMLLLKVSSEKKKLGFMGFN